jgi:hypothetical protein
MNIKITRNQAIQRQKDFGTYLPELLPPVKFPSPLAGNIAIAQTYWLQNVLEELFESNGTQLGSKEEAEELADVLIFLQYLHFTITDEPFVLDLEPSSSRYYVDFHNFQEALRDLCNNRKTWKTYSPTRYNCADWFLALLVKAFDTSPSNLIMAYEEKIKKNKTRASAKDWNLAQSRGAFY